MARAAAAASTMRARAAAALVAALVVIACGDDDGAASGPTRGPSGRGAPATLTGPTETTPAAPDARGRRIREATRTPQAWGAGPTEITEREVEETPGEPARRDLPAELRAALGVPTDCIPADVAATLGTELRLSVRAWVTSTGRVTRAEVGGSAPATLRECVQRRAEGVSMRGPIDDAPREVSTQLVIAIRRQDPPPPPQTEPWRPPAGARPAAVTLPARGPQAPAQGYVPPGSTLPAVGAEGRPEGFVPPSSTLPAIAD